MINKKYFSIHDTKKVLHKIGKQWIVMSVALLAMIGVGATANFVSHSNTPVHVVASATTVSNKAEYINHYNFAGYKWINGSQGTSAKSAIDANVPNGYTIDHGNDNQNFKADGDALEINVSRTKATNKIEYLNGANLVNYVNSKGIAGRSAKSAIDDHVPTGYSITHNSDEQNYKNGNGDALEVSIAKAVKSNKIEYLNGSNLVNYLNVNGNPGSSAKSAIDDHIPSGYFIADGSDAKDFMNGNGDALEVNVNRKVPKTVNDHVANNVEYLYGDQIAGHLMVNGIKGHSAKAAIDNYVPEGYRIIKGTDNKVFKDNLDALEVTVAKVYPRSTRYHYGLVKFGHRASRHLNIKLTKALIEYTSPKFSNDAEVRPLRKGRVMSVKAIYRQGRTVRFQLHNGDFITALKSYTRFASSPRTAKRRTRRTRRYHKARIPRAVKSMFARHHYVRVHMGRRSHYLSSRRMNTVKVLRTRRRGRHITYYVKVGRKYGRVYEYSYHR